MNSLPSTSRRWRAGRRGPRLSTCSTRSNRPASPEPGVRRMFFDWRGAGDPGPESLLQVGTDVVDKFADPLHEAGDQASRRSGWGVNDVPDQVGHPDQDLRSSSANSKMVLATVLTNSMARSIQLFFSSSLISLNVFSNWSTFRAYWSASVCNRSSRASSMVPRRVFEFRRASSSNSRRRRVRRPSM